MQMKRHQKTWALVALFAMTQPLLISYAEPSGGHQAPRHSSPRPTAQTSPEDQDQSARVANLEARMAVFAELCVDANGKVKGEDEKKRVVVSDGDEELDCWEEAERIKAELDEVGGGNVGDEQCPDDGRDNQSWGECLKDVGCNLARSALSSVNPIGKMYSAFVSQSGKQPDNSKAPTCLSSNRGNCAESLVAGIFDNLWGTITGLWDLAVAAVKGTGKWVVDKWNAFWGVEDKSADSAQVASATTDSFITKFVKDPLGAISELGSGIMNMLYEYISQRFMCGKWSGAPYTSTCEEPLESWKCADCDQKLNLACGVGGILAGEVAVAFFTGGAVNLASKAAGKVAQVGAKVAEMFPAVARVGAKLAQAGRFLANSAVGKAVTAFAKGVGKAAVATGKKVIQVASDLSSVVAKKVAAALAKSPALAKTADLATKPIRAYFELLGEAARAGWKSTDEVAELMAARAARGTNQVKAAAAGSQLVNPAQLESALANPKVVDALGRSRGLSRAALEGDQGRQIVETVASGLRNSGVKADDAARTAADWAKKMRTNEVLVQARQVPSGRGFASPAAQVDDATRAAAEAKKAQAAAEAGVNLGVPANVDELAEGAKVRYVDARTGKKMEGYVSKMGGADKDSVVFATYPEKNPEAANIFQIVPKDKVKNLRMLEPGTPPVKPGASAAAETAKISIDETVVAKAPLTGPTIAADQLEKLPFQATQKQARPYAYEKPVFDNQDLARMKPMSYAVNEADELKVVTKTADGVETVNTAKKGDIIMSGPNGEKYVIKPEKFGKNYQGNIGSTMIPEQSPRTVARYDGPEGVIEAPWGEKMRLRPGDYVVQEGPGLYYRIAADEFDKTYNALGRAPLPRNPNATPVNLKRAQELAESHVNRKVASEVLTDPGVEAALQDAHAIEKSGVPFAWKREKFEVASEALEEALLARGMSPGQAKKAAREWTKDMMREGVLGDEVAEEAGEEFVERINSRSRNREAGEGKGGKRTQKNRSGGQKDSAIISDVARAQGVDRRQLGKAIEQYKKKNGIRRNLTRQEILEVVNQLKSGAINVSK